MKAILKNLSRDKFIESIQSKGFAIDKVAKDQIPKESLVKRAKVLFKGRSDRSNVFDKEVNGRLVPVRASAKKPFFRQQTVDIKYYGNVDVLFKAGLKKIQE